MWVNTIDQFRIGSYYGIRIRKFCHKTSLILEVLRNTFCCKELSRHSDAMNAKLNLNPFILNNIPEYAV